MSNDAGPAPAGELAIYKTDDDGREIRVLLQGETAWLTQAQMAELYQTTKQNISLHIRRTHADGELAEEATVKSYLTVAQEGGRPVERRLKHYSLEMILAVGY
ncbi:MAG: hydroxyacid dehydrogenase, partial [Armatimonadia bacterium]|nr:hydroxyacid dehydrogenase [Armatimonadia bacterium]